MIRLFFISCIFLFMLGCTPRFKYRDTIYDAPPEGEASYSELYLDGWHDGCQTGAATAANSKYLYNRSFMQDWKKLTKPDYHEAWRRSFDYCRKIVLKRSLKQFQEIK